jgi:hypothetical protein
MNSIANCRFRENGGCCNLVDICETITKLTREKSNEYRQPKTSNEESKRLANEKEIREFKELFDSF